MPAGMVGGSSHYRAEPQLWLHQEEQRAQMLCCTLLCSQQNSLRKFYWAELAIIPALEVRSCWLPLVDKSRNCRLSGNLRGHTLPLRLSRLALTMSYVWIVTFATYHLAFNFSLEWTSWVLEL
jgi:hypothetical protein